MDPQRTSSCETSSETKCVLCKKLVGKPHSSPESLELPSIRVFNYQSFTHTEVDFARPFYTREDNKVYICLFTCALTRAIHLELTRRFEC